MYFINVFHKCISITATYKETKSLISEVFLSDMILLCSLTLLDYLGNNWE